MRGMAWLVFLVVLLTAGVAHSQNPDGSIVVSEGFATPNTYGGPLPDFFDAWCADSEDGNFCIPTVTLELLDNPSLIIPKHGDVVLLGGAEGLVVGGTGSTGTPRGHTRRA